MGQSTISVHANMNAIYCDHYDDDALDGALVTVSGDDYHFDLFHSKNVSNGPCKCLASVHVDVMLLNSRHEYDGCQSPFQYSGLWQWLHLRCDRNRRSKNLENDQSKIQWKKCCNLFVTMLTERERSVGGKARGNKLEVFLRILKSSNSFDS